MRVARYIGNGQIAIVDEPEPSCPAGGLLVQTEASGLCSGELMDWYMDRKIPHVLGHEVAGVVLESDSPLFSVGSHIFPHHHAPCLDCDMCRNALYVHCEQWRRTRLVPGGMAERFAVPAENLNDTIAVGGMRGVDAALIEPLACVVKSFWQANVDPVAPAPEKKYAVVGLGVMGLMHLLLLRSAGDQLQASETPYPLSLSPSDAGASQWAREEVSPQEAPFCAIGYELNTARIDWARGLGLQAAKPEEAEKADVIFVCPGTQSAVDFAISIANPGAAIVLFAPLPPDQKLQLDINQLYFKDISLRTSYSCGPNDTAQAFELIEKGRVKAEQVVTHFIKLEELPDHYQSMKRGDILKPMVVFE